MNYAGTLAASTVRGSGKSGIRLLRNPARRLSNIAKKRHCLLIEQSLFLI